MKGMNVLQPRIDTTATATAATTTKGVEME